MQVYKQMEHHVREYVISQRHFEVKGSPQIPPLLTILTCHKAANNIFVYKEEKVEPCNSCTTSSHNEGRIKITIVHAMLLYKDRSYFNMTAS